MDKSGYMQRCLELASNGLSRTSPNPMVGCVIEREGTVIGEGYHTRAGEPHAEVNAIQSVKEPGLLKECTLHVNLEPCAHFGKTPPCADLIVKMGIPRVNVGMLDPNPLVSGKGITKLRSAGIEVETGILEDQCRWLNRRFLKSIQDKRPWVILKWAQTLDGFIDIDRGNLASTPPVWITNEPARALVHKWRTEEQAIMVGSRTALLDNPRLDARLWHGKNPVRVTLDKNLDLPKHLHLFDKEIPTLVYSTLSSSKEKNLEIVHLDWTSDLLDQILLDLHNRGIQSLIVEGGEKTLQGFIEKGYWDEARIFTGDKLFGGGVKAPFIRGKLIETSFLGNSRLSLYLNEPG
jgi:diaminohydroxyphosphoribosylaminopyrimidine deaminase / 5-amino-6-(5-phosphoribosylamino)uracil reductase